MKTMPETIEKIQYKPAESLRNGGIANLLNATADSDTVVTLLLPMEEKGAETRKNHIIFKNALSDAARQLPEKARNHGRIGQVLKDLEFFDNPVAEFWQHQENGLVMIIPDSEDITVFKTPFPVEKAVEVSEKPRISRLLPLADDSRIYVLLLDLDGIRLFHAGRWDVEEIELNDVPTSLEEAMRFDDPEKSLQFHTSEVSQTPGSG
ncbi:MAG: hypothetical protein HKN23_17685, partial [Verrucomicrobiales bacterium]|nr:hypothetical protein [Verrucomicrobiales bacterium]